MEEHKGIERREFIGTCGSVLQALLFAGVAGPLIQACETSQVLAPRVIDEPEGIEIDVRNLTTDGAFLVSGQKGPDGKRILVVRKNASTFLAMSMECTHQQCEVGAPANNIMTCPCHSSEYDLEGNVLFGPAPAPLKRYAAVYDAARSILTISV